jgi:hypothetical protein
VDSLRGLGRDRESGTPARFHGSAGDRKILTLGYFSLKSRTKLVEECFKRKTALFITAQHVENVLRIYRRELQRSILVKGATVSRPMLSERVTISAETKPGLLMDRIKYQALEQIQYSDFRELD